MFRLEDLMVGVSPVRARQLLRRAGVATAYDRGDLKVGPGPALFVWLAGALRSRSPVAAEQQDFLLDLLAARLVEAGESIHRELASGERTVGAVTLTVADGTMVGTSGMDHWLDLRSGEAVPALPQAPFELVSYNLTTLFAIHKARLAREAELEARRADACRQDTNPSTGG